jgi:hypothetical protein
MAKRQSKSPLPLTPRARQVINIVVNSVALGTHDNDAEVGAIAQQLKTTPGRLQPILLRLQQQGYITLKDTFVYPTVAGLRAHNPSITDREAQAILRRLR